MKYFYVYILKCDDQSYYVGHTDNLKKRMTEYQNNIYQSYVSNRRPVELVFYEHFSTRSEAIAAERQLKGWSRKKKEVLIKNGWENMKGFCKKSRNKDI